MTANNDAEPHVIYVIRFRNGPKTNFFPAGNTEDMSISKLANGYVNLSPQAEDGNSLVVYMPTLCLLPYVMPADDTLKPDENLSLHNNFTFANTLPTANNATMLNPTTNQATVSGESTKGQSNNSQTSSNAIPSTSKTTLPEWNKEKPTNNKSSNFLTQTDIQKIWSSGIWSCGRGETPNAHLNSSEALPNSSKFSQELDNVSWSDKNNNTDRPGTSSAATTSSTSEETPVPNNVLQNHSERGMVSNPKPNHNVKKPTGLSSKEFCHFCYKNEEPEYLYRNHKVKDENGVVSCPVLRKYVCPNCGESGDKAHTLNYCPQKVSNETEDGIYETPTSSGIEQEEQTVTFPPIGDRDNIISAFIDCPDEQFHEIVSIALPSTNNANNAKKEICKFCLKNNEPSQVYSSHKLHAENGTIACPFLRQLTCNICGATGDDAHTRKYCPNNTYEAFIAHVNSK